MHGALVDKLNNDVHDVPMNGALLCHTYSIQSDWVLQYNFFIDPSLFTLTQATFQSSSSSNYLGAKKLL